MSLTCEIRLEGGARWWLTRESGLPSLCSVGECMDCCEWRSLGVCNPKGYLVVKVELNEGITAESGWYVGFGRLSPSEVVCLRKHVSAEGLATVQAAGQLGLRSMVSMSVETLMRGSLSIARWSFTWRERCRPPRRGNGERVEWSDAVGDITSSGRKWSWCSYALRSC
jgi:hypothetical protein